MDNDPLIEALKGQLLIVLMKRLGKDLTISVDEVDDTANDLLYFEIDQKKREFHFHLKKKN